MTERVVCVSSKNISRAIFSERIDAYVLKLMAVRLSGERKTCNHTEVYFESIQPALGLEKAKRCTRTGVGRKFTLGWHYPPL
jgi:hypothetical protein